MYDDVEAKFSVLERAERVLSSLSDEFPSFIKCMLPSNVAHGFWLHLPKAFCDIYLPTCDTNIILVDEWGNEYKTSYLLERHGLSAGWRAFSISHRLLKGDILIFRLIEPCKLKVDIVRVNGRDVVDAALCLLKFDASENTRDPDLSRKDTRKRKSLVKFIEPYIHDVCKPEAIVQDEGQSALDCCSPHIVDQTEHNSKDSGSEDFEGSDIANHPQSNEFCSSKTSFLCDHPRDGFWWTFSIGAGKRSKEPKTTSERRILAEPSQVFWFLKRFETCWLKAGSMQTTTCNMCFYQNKDTQQHQQQNERLKIFLGLWQPWTQNKRIFNAYNALNLNLVVYLLSAFQRKKDQSTCSNALPTDEHNVSGKTHSENNCTTKLMK
nr:B3 domain-containing protein At5g42700-like isoform X1 [Ipomoea batatas]